MSAILIYCIRYLLLYCRKFDVIKLLIQTGAHLVESSGDIATMLCKYVCVFDLAYISRINYVLL